MACRNREIIGIRGDATAPMLAICFLLILFPLCISGFNTLKPTLSIASSSLSSSLLFQSSKLKRHETKATVPATRLYAGGGGANAVPTIDDWTVLKTGAVKGTVGNHPELQDGYEITTSPLTKAPTKNNCIVVTRSGSKYKLLISADNNNVAVVQKKKTITKANTVKAQQTKMTKQQPAARPAAAAAPVEKSYDLNGKVIGTDKNKKYLLVGKLIRSSSKRSQIYYAYEADDDTGLPNGPRLTVKISNFLDRLTREKSNYERVSSKGRVLFSLKGSDVCFVRKVDFVPSCDASADTKGIPSGSCALVLESGNQNLRNYLESIKGGGGLYGSELRKAAVNICRCIEAMHSSGLVWTDLKAENFVLTGNDNDVKGIDLESCIPNKSNPEDYSPEATPPEFALEEKQGTGFEFKVNRSYDVWSLGMLLLELGLGQSYFKGKSESFMLQTLATTADSSGSGNSIIDPDTGTIRLTEEQKDIITEGGSNKLYLDLITECLQLNPNKRPSITQILLHPYFLTTGFGPITF